MPGDVLMVGEGIETCLAAMQATGHPAWAALSTSGLRALDLPEDVRDVIVLADGDDAGEAAARDCAWRWKREGRRVRIARPPQGMDFNDMLVRRRGGRAMTDNEHRTAEETDRGGHRRRRGDPRSAGGPGREDQARSRRAVHAGGAGASGGAEEGRSRRLRDAARAAEEGRLPGDGARRGARRGER